MTYTVPVAAAGCAMLLAGCHSAPDAAAQSSALRPESHFVANCEPCRFVIASRLPVYAFQFHLHPIAGGARVVDTIFVSPEGSAGQGQRLAVRAMTPVAPADSFFVTLVDVDFDGYRDFALATSLGSANTYADYWVFQPQSREFSYLGNFPIFRVDTLKRQLSTYERGGAGGMIYEARLYAFTSDTLTLLESEKQEATDQPGVFRKTISRRVEGTMRVIREERITTPVPP